jgi:hypothetical protein
MATKKVAAPVTESRVLYTIRLEPSIIAKIEARAKKNQCTHAEVSRQILHAGVARLK